MQGRGQGLCKERCGLKTKGKGLGGEGGTGVTILKWDELVLLEKQQGQGDLSSVGWSRGEWWAWVDRGAGVRWPAAY